jgi:hypothetical protein
LVFTASNFYTNVQILGVECQRAKKFFLHSTTKNQYFMQVSISN